MKTTYKNILITIFMGLLTLLIFSCGGDKAIQKEDESYHNENLIEISEAQYKNAGIVLGKMETRNMSGTIKVNGMLDVPPQNMVTVSIPFGGTVKKTDLLQGMKVVKGQIIAVLEHPDYIQLQQDYLDAKSKLDFMDLELKRQEELQKGNVSSTKTYQQTVSDFESLKTRTSGLEIKLGMLNINVEQIRKNGILKQINLLAPINGFVTEVNVNVGSFINQNDIICKIVDTRHLHAELTVFEKDIMSLAIGQKVRFTFNNETIERTATVYLINKMISADRTVRVHCHLDKEDVNLLPGMYLKAYVETLSKGVSSVPSKAVVQLGDKNFIFTLKGKESEQGKIMYHFDRHEVLIGIVGNGYTEILVDKGLDSNSAIAVNGAYDLLSKMNVREEEE